MDHPAAGPRHLADRPRLQPARRRAARRVRPAALIVLLAAACAGDEPAPDEDYRARFLEQRWDDLDEWSTKGLVAGLQEYVAADGPIHPRRDARFRALHRFLLGERPDPRGFMPLFGPHDEPEVNDRLLRRDNVALAVLTTFIRRIYADPDDPHRAELFDVIAQAGVHFSFDPVYKDSHTQTGVEVSGLFTDANVPPEPASRAAIERHLEAMIGRWRGRVTPRATSTFFGIVLRHLGPAGAERLSAEWEAMDADERYDLLKRLADEESAGPAARGRMVDGLLDYSLEVRDAAYEALLAHGAPTGDLDPSARDSEIERRLEPLRRWAETES